MELATLCAESGAPLEPLARLDGIEVIDLSLRLDTVSPGTFFACVPGSSQDGHELAPQAAARGASALLVERPLVDVGLPQVRARRVREALGPLAHVIAGRPSEHMAVVGVTGTNGKTTTAFLVAAMFEAAGLPSGLLGTVEARVGGVRERLALTTPEAPDLHRLLARMLDAGDTACVLEASSIAISMGRLDALQLAAVGFTNLSQDHLDFHGSMEAYLAAKASLFDGRCPRAANADDPAGSMLPAELRYAVETPADVWARRVVLGATATQLEVDTPRGSLSIESPLRGRFNVENVLCAISVALLVDLPDEAIVAGAGAVVAPPGRFEPVDAGQPFAVIVDYAHTPTGIEAVLRGARAATGGRVLCVFGAGGDRDRAKRPLMAAAAEAGADRVYVTSDNPRSEDPLAIVAEIVSGLERPERAIVEPDRRAAIALALADADIGDAVVICGKGHEQGQEIAGVTLVSGDPEAVVRGLSIDSRTVSEGDLFAALPGERADGHDFLAEAVERGAVAVLCEPYRAPAFERAAVLETNDVLAGLQRLTRQVRRRSTASVVGVAGSAGKTSTKDALRALLAPHRRVVAAHRNHNNELGVPLTLARIEADTEVCICELAMRGRGQIAELAEIAEPGLGVITCVGPEHLEFLGSVEAVAAAQAELLEAMPSGSVAIVPDDEPLLEPFLRDDLDVRRFGMSEHADARVVRFEPDAGGAEVELEIRGERVTFRTNLRAPHHRLNLAAAAVAAHALGVPVANLGHGASSVELSPHRGQELPRRDGGVVIDDAYNANPSSMRAALESLHARQGEGRLVAVLGEMAELGPDADALHREIAARTAGLDLVVGVGERARLYLDGAEDVWFADVDAAAEGLPALLQPGDVVLLKASRSVGLERLVEAAS